MKHKLTVKIDGADREIEVDLDLDKILTEEVLKQRNLLTKETVAQSFTPKDVFETELARRVASITKGNIKLEDIPKDESLKKQVLDLLGVEITKDGKAKLSADQVSELQETWRTNELVPVTQRAEKAETRAKGLLGRILNADIVREGASRGIQKHLLTPVREGAAPPIVSMLGDLFGYDAESDGFYVRKGEGYEFSADPKEHGSAYMGVSEFMKEWAAKKENAPFIDAGKPGGPKPGAPGAEGGVVTIDAPEPGKAMNLADYQAAQEQAGEGGRVHVKGAHLSD